MKTKQTNGLHKAELTSMELRLLVDYYAQAIEESRSVKSPILLDQRDANFNRKLELEGMFDGRHWNKGKPRKAKAPADPGPELPMHPPECVCAECESKQVEKNLKL